MYNLKRTVSLIFCLVMVLFFCACSFELSVEKLFGVKTDITVEEKTVYDENGIKITVKGLLEKIVKDGPFVSAQFFLQFDIENNSSKNIYITTNYFCANEIMIDAWALEYYDAGETGEFNVDLSPAGLQRCGISLIQTLEFSLVIGDSDLHEDIVTTAPIRLTTSADPSYVQPNGDDGVVLYDGTEAKIVVKMTDDEEVRLYVKNKMNQTINVVVTCMSVNGSAYEGYENTAHVVRGKRGYTLVAHPRDLVNAKATNTFVFRIVIYDDSSDNMAFLKVIRDLGELTAVLGE